MAQQYLPATYNMPRYANTQIGVPFVSAYDPTVNDRYLGLVQQEYQKAFSANQALAAREAEIADIFSIDEAGKEETLGKYRSKIGAIREAYNQDLALAAPQLARAVAEERANPWYGKNVQYNKEFERRQKLLDQFGPNIRITKDLPQGSLNDMDMEDISFNYWNQAMADEMLQRDLGKAASMTRTLSPEPHPDYPDLYAYERTLKGLDETEAAEAAQRGAKRIIQSLENSGVTVDDTMREQIIEHAGLWADKNLRGGITKRPIQIGSITGGSGSGNNGQFYSPGSRLIYTGNVVGDIPSEKEQKKAGEGLYEAYQEGTMTPEQEDFWNKNADLSEALTYEKQAAEENFSGGFDRIKKHVEDAPIEEIKIGLQKGLQQDLSFEDALSASDVVERTETPNMMVYGAPPEITYSINGKPLDDLQLNQLRSKYNDAERKKKRFLEDTLVEVANRMFPHGARRGYAVSATSDAIDRVNAYVAGTMIGPETDYDKLRERYGIKIYKDSGKEKRSEKKVGKSLKAIGNFDFEPSKQMGAIKYIGADSNNAPEIQIKTSEGRIEIPLKDLEGQQHGMQLSLILNNPDLINDVFNYNYDTALNKRGGSVPVSEVLGIPKQIEEDLGIGNIRRVKANEEIANYLGVEKGTKVYISEIEGEGAIVRETPNELIFGIATHIGNLGLIRATDPLYQYLYLQNNELATPKDIKDSNLARMQ